jgi:two-component system, OmpR family, sensor histidine kinase MtrB
MLRPARTSAVVSTARRAWHRSLQLRIVSITLVCSTALVAGFGLLVGNMITNGLVRAKTEAATRLVAAGSESARDQLLLIDGAQDPAAPSTMLTVVAGLANQDQASGVVVALLPEDPTSPLHGQSRAAEQAFVQVPERFRAAVTREHFVKQQLMLNLDGTGPQLFLGFGRRITLTWGTLQLYYFFPLREEVSSAALVRNSILITGLSLVVLLAAVAALVTRMVVRPVRIAARTAQRLSAGLLDQRMEIRGQDDLAALAASFNQMAETLQRHILRLEEMSRLQRRFTSDVSHELRTPLTTIRMAADLLFTERQRFDAPVARSAELLQTELDRFEGLLTDLLEISRFDAGFAMLDAEVTDLVPLVRRVADRLRPLAEQAGVPVDVELPEAPVVAEIDPRRVERILRNLIGNAVEHAEGRPVKVRLAAEHGAVAVSIRDFGVGLRPGEEKLVFNRFWRADPSRARQTGGTGLGLSISQEDARLHGGWLEAWGAPGRGAQFRLTLPAHSGDRLVASPIRLVPDDVALTAESIKRSVAAAITAAAGLPYSPGMTASPEPSHPDASHPDASHPDPSHPDASHPDPSPAGPVDGRAAEVTGDRVATDPAGADQAGSRR